jgi:integrase
MRDFILLALLTGARRANLCAMRWPEIKPGGFCLANPRHQERHPAKRDPLPGSGGDSQGAAGSDSGRLRLPWAWRKWSHGRTEEGGHSCHGASRYPLRRNDPNGVTLHDLRRTLGSWQARTGASLAIIGKSLNHKSQQATAIYARLDLDPVRASVNTATAAMMEAGGMKEAAEVVQLPKRGAA